MSFGAGLRGSRMRECKRPAKIDRVVAGFRLRVKLLPPLKLRRIAVALAKADRRTAVASAEAVSQTVIGPPQGGHYDCHESCVLCVQMSYWRNVRLKRPVRPSAGGAVPGTIRDTP